MAISRIISLMVLLCASAPAFAENRDPAHGDNRGGNHGDQGGNKGGKGGGHGGKVSVPEFDPTAAGAIAAVIAGGSVVLARRRKR